MKWLKWLMRLVLVSTWRILPVGGIHGINVVVILCSEGFHDME